MSDWLDKAPPIALGPSATRADLLHDPENEDHKRKDSQRLDVKLRLNENVLVNGPHEPSAESQTDVSDEEGPAS